MWPRLSGNTLPGRPSLVHIRSPYALMEAINSFVPAAKSRAGATAPSGTEGRQRRLPHRPASSTSRLPTEDSECPHTTTFGWIPQAQLDAWLGLDHPGPSSQGQLVRCDNSHKTGTLATHRTGTRHAGPALQHSCRRGPFHTVPSPDSSAPWRPARRGAQVSRHAQSSPTSLCPPLRRR